MEILEYGKGLNQKRNILTKKWQNVFYDGLLNWKMMHECIGQYDDKLMACHSKILLSSEDIYRRYIDLIDGGFEEFGFICPHCGIETPIFKFLIPKLIRKEAKKFDYELSKKLKEEYKIALKAKWNEPNIPYSFEVMEILNGHPILRKKLIELAEKQDNIKELRKKFGELDKPMVITINGTPRAGKTTCIDNLYDFFKKCGFKTDCLEEPAGLVYKTLKNSEEKQNLLKDRIGFVDKQYQIGEKHIAEYKKGNEILLCDRGISDTFVWYEWYYQKGMMSKENYQNFMAKNTRREEYYNYLYMLYGTAESSLNRDALNSLSIAPRTTMNKEGINGYNNSLRTIKEALINSHDTGMLIDTTYLDRMDASIIVANDVLDKVQSLYLRRK